MDPDGNTWFMASPAKALADYVYVHRPDWTALDEAAANLRIEADELTCILPEQLEVLGDNYSNYRVRRFLANWKEALCQ